MIHHVDITSVIILFFKKTFFYMHFFAHSRSTLRSIRVIDGSCNPLLHPRSGLCFPLPWVGFWVRATPHPTTPQAVQFVPTMAVVSLCAHIQCLARNAPRISVFQVLGGGGVFSIWLVLPFGCLSKEPKPLFTALHLCCHLTVSEFLLASRPIWHVVF